MGVLSNRHFTEVSHLCWSWNSSGEFAENTGCDIWTIKGFLGQNSNFLGSSQQYITFCINCWQIPCKHHNCRQLWKIVGNCPQLAGDLLLAIVSNCCQSGTVGKMCQLPTIANNSWQSVLNLIANNCPQLSTIMIAFWSCPISMSHLLFNLSWILLDLVQYCYTLLLYL